ncbi:MAG: universal stress protein [Nitrospirales bacterium]|nr:universal stress protein [Nitrospirales bacterium]
MVPIKRLLVATDFSKGAEGALNYASFLATVWSARLKILHVQEADMAFLDRLSLGNKLSPKRSGEEIDQRLDALRARLAQRDLVVEAQQLIGIPNLQIIQAAKEWGADLIVLGTQGQTGGNHLLFGSTAAWVVRGAPCPVLVIPRAEIQGHKVLHQSHSVSPDIRRIVVPVDFSKCSLEAVDYVVPVARHFNASVTLLYVMESLTFDLYFKLTHPPHMSRTLWKIRSQLSDLTVFLRKQGLQVQDEVVEGKFAMEAILGRIHERRPDLVVMGTHGRRGFSRLLNGSITESVLHRAQYPILTVKSPTFPEENPSNPSKKSSQEMAMA